MATQIKAPPISHTRPKAPKGMVAQGLGGGKWKFVKMAAGKAAGGKPGRGRRQQGMVNPLAPLSAKQIRQQAASTIGKAYGSNYTDLNQQQQNAQNLYEKQNADDKYFADWLHTQGQAMTTGVQAANQKLADLATGIRSTQEQAFAAQPGTLIDQANQRAGNVTNNAQQAPLTTGLAQSNVNNMGLLSNAAIQQVETGKQANVSAANMASANQARVQTIRGLELSNLNKTLQGIAQNRLKLNAARTGDIAKEIARLQGIEIQKAQFGVSQAALQQKLGIQMATAKSLIQSRAGNLAVAQQNAATNLTRAENSKMQSDRQYKLDVARYNASVAKDRYEQQHGLGPYRPGKGSSSGRFRYGKTLSGKPAASPATQRIIYGRIDGTAAALKHDIQKYHHGNITPQTLYFAYHDLLSGRATGVGYNPSYGTAVLNAAYNSLLNGLTPGDLAWLEGQGLTNIGGHYQIQPGPREITGPPQPH